MSEVLIAEPTTYMRRATLLPLLLALGACTQAPTSPDQIFSNAEYSGSVSSLYAVGAPTAGTTPTNFKWKDSTGTVHALSELVGKTVLLNFWATWCGNCVDEMPVLQDIQTNANGSVVVIGVSTDMTAHPFTTVRDFVQSHNIKYQVVVDSMMSLEMNYTFLANGSSATPETFVIGKDGNVKMLLQGAQSKQGFLDDCKGELDFE